MRSLEYRTHVARLCTHSHFRQHRKLLESFEFLEMGQRSAIAKLCRAQCYPPKSTRLSRMTDTLSPDFKRSILPLCQTPLLAGLILHMILLAPMTDREISRIYHESMIKEMAVMESCRRASALNFEPIFGMYDEDMNDLIPRNRAMAFHIHTQIDHWIESLSKDVLFPKVGSKTVSKMTSAEFYAIDIDYVPISDIGITPIDLERMYHNHGIKVDGPCEMRQKWYCSNLQPRTYYAQGGTAYHTSKYLAKPLVQLCDILPAINRRSRVDPGRIIIKDDSYDVAYYDLTSFTSNLHIQRDFMLRLARYCVGVDVRILDSIEGIITVDLGAMIYEYGLNNLTEPTYTLPSKYSDPSVLHYHNVAGFLGVYGNIASATFIHGVVMAMTHDSLDENNVAGDDGLDVTKNVDLTLQIVELMGIVKDDKTFRDSEGCCIHLKRPITRIGNRLLQGQLITWPSLEPGQENVDSRYPYLKGLTDRERKDAIAGSITAFLRSLEFLPMTQNDLDMVDSYLLYVYQTYGLPKAGCVPQIMGINSSFVPIYEKRFIGLDPIHNTIARSYNDVAKLPRRGKIDHNTDMFDDDTFECNSTRLLSYLTTLGYLEQEKMDELVFGYDGLQQLLKEYTRPDPCVYRYTVLCKLPNWITDFMFSNSI
jgi:hypothetical protein